MAYQPRPGTVAEAALKILRSVDGQLSTDDLIARIGCSALTLSGCLMAALKHSVIQKELRFHDHKRRAFWQITPRSSGEAGFDADVFLAFMNTTIHGRPEAFGGVDIDAVHRRSEVPHHPV